MKTVRDIDVAGLNVLVRADLEWESVNCPRQQATEAIQAYLKAHQAANIKIIGHGSKIYPDLRDDPREKANDPSLAAELAEGFDIYINEAFATSHRKHCSIDALPRLMKQQGKEVAIGLRFEKELEVLSQITPPNPPLNLRGGNLKGGVIGTLLVIGGTKVIDKNRYADELEKKGYVVLRGGLLNESPLRPDGLDITEEAVSNFKFQISNSPMIVAAGVMGKYEDPNAEYGTKEVLTAIANSKAYKIAGGGNIEAAISKYDLSNKFDWISVGGGAMLEYLSTGTLVGIEAILD